MRNIKLAFWFALSFLSAGVIWQVTALFLPKLPVIYTPKEFGGEFYSINILRIFTSSNKTSQKSSPRVKTAQSLKGVELKAIYNDGKKAFIIISANKKTVFLDINQTYNGYRLVKIYNSYAVFEKNSKKYTLAFKEDKKTKTYTKQAPAQQTSITKETLEKYKKNISKIWNEIGIIKVNNGYKITYVKKNSIFDKLGLKRGDIITKVNGEKITNDAQAWNLYKNIDKLDSIEIEIIRNNKTKVLYYEIN